MVFLGGEGLLRQPVYFQSSSYPENPQSLFIHLAHTHTGVDTCPILLHSHPVQDESVEFFFASLGLCS